MKSSWNSIVHLLLHCLFCLSIKDRIANYPNVISIGRILAHLEFFCSVFEFHRKRKPIFLFFFFIPLKSAYLMATVFISLLTPFLKLLSNPNFLWSYFQLMRIKIYKNCALFSPSLSAYISQCLPHALASSCDSFWKKKKWFIWPFLISWCSSPVILLLVVLRSKSSHLWHVGGLGFFCLSVLGRGDVPLAFKQMVLSPVKLEAVD